MTPYPAALSPSRGVRWAVAVAVIGAVLLVYWPALWGGWLWDDGLELWQNPAVKAAEGWWTPWVRPAGMDYFPLKGSIQWIEWRAFGESTLGYHAVSAALHAVGALLVWRLLSQSGIPYGGFAALVFAVHPVAVESVAWMSEQKNGLSLVLSLAASCLYLDFSRRGGWGRYAAATAAFLAALLCKSTVVMLPACLAALVLWGQGRGARRDLWALLPWFALSLGLGLVTISFQGHRAIGVTGPMPALPERVTQAGWSLLLYARDAVLPLWLAPLYPPAPMGAWALVPWTTGAAVAALLVARRRSWGRHGLVALAWFFLPLLPVCGVVALSYLRVAPRADHLAYLSLVGSSGVGAAVVALALGARPSRTRSWLVAVLATAGLVGLGAIARAQAAHYRSAKALWSWAVERNPDAWLAHNNLGQVLMGEGRLEEALAQFDAASALRPDSAEVQANRGDVDLALGRLPLARAAFERAVALDPTLSGAWYNLAVVCLKGGDTARALAEARRALAIDPGHVGAHNVLGLALARIGRSEEASVEFRAALRLNPAFVEAHLNLGNLAARAGQGEEALNEYRAALALDPSYEPARRNLRSVLRFLGREEGGPANPQNNGGRSP